MSKPPSSMNQQETRVFSPRLRDDKKTITPEIDDPEKAVEQITRLIKQLHAKKSSPQDKELSTAQLLGLAKGKKECRKIIERDMNAMTSFISLLRNGTLLVKFSSASILTILCKDENVRNKVLRGRCIPPLLTLLKSNYVDSIRDAAEAIFEVFLCGMVDDNIGTKIFVKDEKKDKMVEGYLVGALRNLCGDNMIAKY